MRGIKSLNSYAIHFLINKFFIYKGDMSFKTLNISMAKILKRDRYNHSTVNEDINSTLCTTYQNTL